MASPWFRRARIGVLLGVLVVVGADAWRTKRRVQMWTTPLPIRVHPLAAGPEVQAYVEGLTAESFAALAPFFEREAHRFQVYGSPVIDLSLGELLESLPPAAPEGAGVLSAIGFSLQLRYWAWRHAGSHDGPRIFVIYHEPREGRVLEHSYGLPEGLIGVVHAFASDSAEGSNQVVIAHEVLHTVGATDKYDEAGQPLYPEGYAEPEQQPPLPQARAELMAGRIPTSPTEARLPNSLDECVVNEATAREIRWIWRAEGE